MIKIIFDNQLKQSKIEVPLLAPSQEEVPDGGQQTAAIQTVIQGVCTPLVKICGVVFNFDEIIRMTLYDNETTPTLSLVINDSKNYLANMSAPGGDNEVRLQIIPPFDDAYKKIDLTFYINSISIENNMVRLNAIYKVPDLYISRLESFGETDTYQLFKNIASLCKLGFASNCEDNEEDKRYVYCNNCSYLDTLNAEIQRAGVDNKVFDYWIDLWNTINYVDMSERFNAKDSKEDMEVWVVNDNINKVDSVNKNIGMLCDGIITNHPTISGQLKAIKYKILTETDTNASKGTDRVCSIYKNGEVIDTLFEDGNIQNDIFTKYYYLGENIGDYDYLTSSFRRDNFIDLMNKNSIEVCLSSPVLGFTRGMHVKFAWYENNMFYKADIKSMGGEIVNDDFPDDETSTQDQDTFIQNKQVSGEYMILGTKLKYEQGKWQNILTLVRPSENQKTYIKQ